MEPETVIEAVSVVKSYPLYGSPRERLLDAAGFFRHVRRNERRALDNVSFTAARGEALGLVGSNGAGKSTMLKIIAGVVQPDSGSVRVSGKVSALLELGAGFHPDYTGVENVILTGRIMGVSRSEMEKRLPEILAFADIGDYAYQPVRTYSSGMFARLAFASSTSVDADVLIVDEALSVGDTFFQNRCFRRFEELRAGGTTLLIVSHDLETIRRMTERCLWLESGRVKMYGGSREVCNAYAAEIHRKENMDYKKAEVPGYSPGFTDAASGGAEFDPMKYPAITGNRGDITHKKVRIRSCCFEDSGGRIVREIWCAKQYRLVILFETDMDLPECICGYVLQNKKGVSIVNSNTLTVQGGSTFRVMAGSVCRVCFSFTLPELYEDEYLVDCAVADGPSVMSNEMLAWCYGALSVTVRNERPCLAMMDIPSETEIDIQKGSYGRSVMKKCTDMI